MEFESHIRLTKKQIYKYIFSVAKTNCRSVKFKHGGQDGFTEVVVR